MVHVCAYLRCIVAAARTRLALPLQPCSFRCFLPTDTCAQPPPQTPLQVAIINKQLMIVGLLSESKAKLNFDDPASALCTAAGEGDLAQVKRLIDNGVDPNSSDYDRRTGLVVVELLSCGTACVSLETRCAGVMG